MKLTQLRTLLAVQETGSLQEASRVLHTSQSALSRAIKELELELGVPLLERSNRGATATAYGERLLQYARHALGDLERGRQEIEAMKGRAGQQVTIGVTSAVTFMTPVQEALAEFVAEMPRIRLHVLEMRPRQMLPMLRGGGMDFALISQIPQHAQTLEWLPICRIPMRVVTRNDNPARHARSLRELMDEAWLTQDQADNEQSTFHQLFRQNGLDIPQQVIECPAVGLMGYLLYQTRVLSLVSRWSLDNPVDPDFPRLVSGVDVIEPTPDSFISLVCVDHDLMPRPAVALFARMREKLRARFPDFG